MNQQPQTFIEHEKFFYYLTTSKHRSSYGSKENNEP
jgi:hypothetical protein